MMAWMRRLLHSSPPPNRIRRSLVHPFAMPACFMSYSVSALQHAGKPPQCTTSQILLLLLLAEHAESSAAATNPVPP